MRCVAWRRPAADETARVSASAGAAVDLSSRAAEDCYSWWSPSASPARPSTSAAVNLVAHPRAITMVAQQRGAECQILFFFFLFPFLLLVCSSLERRRIHLQLAVVRPQELQLLLFAVLAPVPRGDGLGDPEITAVITGNSI